MAVRGKQRRLDAGRMHGRAGVRFCDVRTSAEGMDAGLEHFRAKWIAIRVKKMRQDKKLEPDSDSILNQRFHTMSFAAINPPPAIKTAAIAMTKLSLAKPARIRNPVESSGVA